jgi:hypothetical protein
MVVAKARWFVQSLIEVVKGNRAMRRDLAKLIDRVERLEEAHRASSAVARRADRTSMQIKLVDVLNRTQQPDLARIETMLDDRRIGEHVRRAIASAPLVADPYEHVVVEHLLPDDVYDLLRRAIPPAEFFDDHDRIKQNLTFPMEYGPTLTARVWGYFDDVIARTMIRPAVLEKFHGPLQTHFATVFGAAFVDRANALPQAASGGRLMLRRPGYHLDPHRDPKRSMLTCLMYLARDGDGEQYGTQIFRVDGDSEADYKQTYYPEQAGGKCELVTVVPYRPNTMLVFLNSRGAHGADIPAGEPADLERYTYQFYVAPLNEALAALIKSLPTERRLKWRSKGAAHPEYA